MIDFSTILYALPDINQNYYDVKELGKIGNSPITLIRPKNMIPYRKNILIIAGTHGEEIAGPWSLCRLLTLNKFQQYDANVSIIPLINPMGFNSGMRYNCWNEPSNSGFVESSEPLSHEGKILIDNIDELKPLSQDGFLTLHENDQRDNYYLFVFSEKRPVLLVKNIQRVVKNYFEIQSDGIYSNEREGTYQVQDGYVFNFFDNSFEHYLYATGTPVCITSETPASDQIPLKKRIDATCKIVDVFISSIVQSPKMPLSFLIRDKAEIINGLTP